MNVDIYTEPDPDPNTLANLGPLRALAGIWQGIGVDTHPVAEGSEDNAYSERIELQPIDAQTNGPQLFYGLRYHTRIVKLVEPAMKAEIETFHDQVGYWLWEPATKSVIQTLAIPRAQVAMAGGTAEPDATTFEATAKLGSATFGICSGPFLDRAFRTTSYTIHVTIHPDGTWSYDQDTILETPGRAPFHHRDRCTFVRIAQPTPNPLAR